MTIIKWRDAYNTGVVRFDREHHTLVELIDVMFDAVRGRGGKEAVDRACAELVAYTIEHFANEEQAMAAVDYPELEQHQAEHARLREEAAAFQERINADFPDGVTDLYHFLRDWLINHIQESDKRYGPYLQELQNIDGDTATWNQP